MPTITWYLTNNSVSNGSDLSLTDPGTEAYRSPTTGWVVSTGSTNRSEYFNDVERAATTFSGTTVPDGTLDTTNGDFWTSPTALTGSFASGNWTISVCVRAQTNGGAHDGLAYARIFRGTNQSGAGATEVTASATAGTGVTNLATTTTQTSTVTINPGAFDVTGEYIFIQIAWGRTGAGGMTSDDVNIRIGNASSAGSRVVTADFTTIASGTGSAAGAGAASGTGASTALSTGSASGSGTASAVGTGAIPATGAASGSGTATGVGIAANVADGAASGTGTAAATGQALGIGVGSAAGTGAASGAGLESAIADGAAAGSGTASGVGNANVSGTGSAAGSGAASGTGQALGVGVGSADGTGTASGASLTAAGPRAIVTWAELRFAQTGGVALSVGTATGTSSAEAVSSTDVAPPKAKTGGAIVGGSGRWRRVDDDLVSLRARGTSGRGRSKPTRLTVEWPRTSGRGRTSDAEITVVVPLVASGASARGATSRGALQTNDIVEVLRIIEMLGAKRAA